MEYKINVQLTKRELVKLIELARKGIMSSDDRQLIERIEKIVKAHEICTISLDALMSVDLDEIPF